MMRSLLLLLALSLLFPASALAHRVTLFAWVEGETLNGEAAFGGGKPAVEQPVTVTDAASGEELAALATDAEGRFSLPLTEVMKSARQGLTLTVQAGPGHAADWTVTPAELGIEPETAASSDTGAADSATPSANPAASATAPVDPALAQRVERLEARVAELSHKVNAPKPVDPAAVLGGLGFLLGLGAFLSSRRAGAKRS